MDKSQSVQHEGNPSVGLPPTYDASNPYYPPAPAPTVSYQQYGGMSAPYNASNPYYPPPAAATVPYSQDGGKSAPYNASNPYYPPPAAATVPYSQDGGMSAPNMNFGAPPVTVQPTPVGQQNVVVTQGPLHQPRPAHAFAIGTMIFACITFVLTFPTSALCTIPAMIFSGLALARDHKVEEAKTMSWISLVLTLVYYACLIVAIIIIVIVVVVASNKVNEIDPPFDPFDSSYNPWWKNSY